MCFTVNLNLVKEEISDRFGVEFPSEYRYEPSYYYHAFGLPELPVICSQDTGTVRMLKWGLIPPWIRTREEADEIRLKTLNARSDTAGSKPSFADSYKNKRCLIPVRGFYEWQHKGRDKIPWFIYPASTEILVLAGLYSEWTDKTTGEKIDTFTILTTEANLMMADIHNSKKRMPVILHNGTENEWLNKEGKFKDPNKILIPCPEDFLKAHTIGPLINSRTADKNTPDLVKPYNYSENTLF
jgi:putative SOS response-associated peptidase YedK